MRKLLKSPEHPKESIHPIPSHVIANGQPSVTVPEKEILSSVTMQEKDVLPSVSVQPAQPTVQPQAPKGVKQKGWRLPAIFRKWREGRKTTNHREIQASSTVQPVVQAIPDETIAMSPDFEQPFVSSTSPPSVPLARSVVPPPQGQLTAKEAPSVSRVSCPGSRPRTTTDRR